MRCCRCVFPLEGNPMLSYVVRSVDSTPILRRQHGADEVQDGGWARAGAAHDDEQFASREGDGL